MLIKNYNDHQKVERSQRPMTKQQIINQIDQLTIEAAEEHPFIASCLSAVFASVNQGIEMQMARALTDWVLSMMSEDEKPEIFRSNSGNA